MHSIIDTYLFMYALEFLPYTFSSIPHPLSFPKILLGQFLVHYVFGLHLWHIQNLKMSKTEI